MVPIILLSCSKCERLLGGLVSALGGRERVTVDRENVIEQGGDDYLLCLRRRMPEVSGEGAAVLCSWQGKAELPSGVTAAALSRNRRARRLLRQSGTPAVCCGMSVTDSLTLSSITEDSAVISVQRSITDMQGCSVEPCEIPVKLTSPISPDALMLAYAAALLCGERPEKI